MAARFAYHQCQARQPDSVGANLVFALVAHHPTRGRATRLSIDIPMKLLVPCCHSPQQQTLTKSVRMSYISPYTSWCIIYLEPWHLNNPIPNRTTSRPCLKRPR